VFVVYWKEKERERERERETERERERERERGSERNKLCEKQKNTVVILLIDGSDVKLLG
jgi:hypothetical protein